MSIEGKVAAILNERDLVINKGSEGGVAEGMKFGVMEKDVAVKDPDTGEILGHLDREKIRVEIVEVRPKFSIGKTYETYVVNVGGTFPDLTRTFRRMFEPPQLVTRVRTLRADNTSRFEPLDEENSFVKIGDPVVQVEEVARVND